jgi:hypothetical protein
VKISRRTHGYYRKVILPAIADYCGYDLDNGEAHRNVKAAFFGMHPDDPELPSMRTMDQETATRFLDYALRQAAEMSLVLEDPMPREER